MIFLRIWFAYDFSRQSLWYKSPRPDGSGMQRTILHIICKGCGTPCCLLPARCNNHDEKSAAAGARQCETLGVSSILRFLSPASARTSPELSLTATKHDALRRCDPQLFPNVRKLLNIFSFTWDQFYSQAVIQHLVFWAGHQPIIAMSHCRTGTSDSCDCYSE